MTEAIDKDFGNAVRDVLGNACLELSFEKGEAQVLLHRSRLVEAMEKLREAPFLRFDQLMDVGTVDWLSRVPRFDVVYQLLSPFYNKRLRVIVQVGELASVPTVTGVYPAAGWFEREAYDLMGVTFDGHPDLRRLLTDYGFEGHPLRRDFPLTGFTQKRYDDLQCRVVDEPVSLQQDYRAFDACSPWRGMTDVQKREGEA